MFRVAAAGRASRRGGGAVRGPGERIRRGALAARGQADAGSPGGFVRPRAAPFGCSALTPRPPRPAGRGADARALLADAGIPVIETVRCAPPGGGGGRGRPAWVSGRGQSRSSGADAQERCGRGTAGAGQRGRGAHGRRRICSPSPTARPCWCSISTRGSNCSSAGSAIRSSARWSWRGSAACWWRLSATFSWRSRR